VTSTDQVLVAYNFGIMFMKLELLEFYICLVKVVSLQPPPAENEIVSKLCVCMLYSVFDVYCLLQSTEQQPRGEIEKGMWYFITIVMSL